MRVAKEKKEEYCNKIIKQFGKMGAVVSSDEFKTRINRIFTKDISISGIDVKEKTLLNKDLNPIGVILSNCYFDHLIFDNIDLKSGIKFIGCTFNTLSFSNCKTSEFDAVFNKNDYAHIIFDNCRIKNFTIDSCNIEKGIKISNKSEIEVFYISSLNCDKGSLFLGNSTLNKKFDIRGISNLTSIEIRQNCIINSKIKFDNVRLGSLVFTDTQFTKDIHIWAGTIGSFTFNDGTFEDDLIITNVPITNSLSVIGAEFKKTFAIKLNNDISVPTGTINKLYIESTSFKEQFQVIGDNKQINDLKIKANKKLEGVINFEFCNIEKAELSGNNHDANIVFNNCSYNILQFDFFSNFSNLSFISTKSNGNNSCINISNSDLGSIRFFNTDFYSFERIEIFNSNLSDINTANVKWFSDKKLNTKVTYTSEDHSNNKEIYRQIKNALEKKGNRIEALAFKALEIKAYKKELFLPQPWYKKIWHYDRFILWVGQTNNYGQNWLKAVGFAIIFCVLFYIPIIIGISEKIDCCFSFDIKSIVLTLNEFWDHLYALPQLMNPVHSLSSIFDYYPTIGGWPYFFDYLLKVFLAFFIFQIVSAFRKFMK